MATLGFDLGEKQQERYDKGARIVGHLNPNLFGGYHSSGYLQEPVGKNHIGHGLRNNAVQSRSLLDAEIENKYATIALSNLEGKLLFGGSQKNVSRPYNRWEWTGSNELPFKGNVIGMETPEQVVWVESAAGYSEDTAGDTITGEGAVVFSPLAVDFDDSGQNLQLATHSLTTPTDGTISFWFNRSVNNPEGFISTDETNSSLTGGAKIYMAQDGGIRYLYFRHRTLTTRETQNYENRFGWFHVIWSWNSSNSRVFVNDIEVTLDGTLGTGSYDYDIFNLGCMYLVAGYELTSCVSEMYFDTTYFDLSVEANRRKFIAADGTPADLGSDGSLPSGSQPEVYVSGGASVWNAGTNKGSAGGFTLIGNDVTDCSTTPSLELTVLPSNANLKTIEAQVGAQIYIGDARSAWGTVSTLPSELVGVQMTDCINNSDTETITMKSWSTGKTVVVGARQNGWSNTVDFSSWAVSGLDHTYSSATLNELYVKVFDDGAHVLDNNSAMYYFRPYIEAPTITQSVDFDGTARLAATGTSTFTSKEMTISCWVYLDNVGGAGTAQHAIVSSYTGGDGDIRLVWTSGTIYLIAYDATRTTNIVQLNTLSGTTLTTGNWYHIIASFNTATSTGKMYINDIDENPTVGAMVADGLVGWDEANFYIGYSTLGPSYMDGRVAELYMTDEYIDLDVEANRRKFIDALGSPVSLGADGSTPTGTQPRIYFSGESYLWNLGKNFGSWSDFTMTGGVQNDASVPYIIRPDITKALDFPGSPSCFTGNGSGTFSSKVGLLSFWCKTTTTGNQVVFSTRPGAGTTNIDIMITLSVLDVKMRISNIVRLGLTGTTILTDGVWHHCVVTWDATSSANTKMYIDGVAETLSTKTVQNYSYSWNQSWFTVGRRTDVNNTMNGCLAEVYITDQYLDIGVAGNLAQFYSGGMPVSLGLDGSLPTGTQPRVYLSGDDWTHNFGSSADFTEVAPIKELCSGSPGDPPTADATRAVDFDGTDYGVGTGSATVDSKVGIISSWVRFDTTGNTEQWLSIANPSDGTSGRVVVGNTSADKLFCQGRTSGGTTVFSSVSTETFSTGTWYHVLVAWDAAAATVKTYVNDIAWTPSGSVSDLNIYWNESGLGIGGKIDGTFLLNGCIAELYATTEYLDIGVEANRRKFLSASGSPVDLGSDGSVPTGTQPLVYFSGAAGSWNSGSNYGSWGDFTVTGSITNCATQPSITLGVGELSVSSSSILSVSANPTSMVDSPPPLFDGDTVNGVSWSWAPSFPAPNGFPQFFTYANYTVNFATTVNITSIELFPRTTSFSGNSGWLACPNVKVNGTSLSKPTSYSSSTTSVSISGVTSVTVELTGGYGYTASGVFQYLLELTEMKFYGT